VKSTMTGNGDVFRSRRNCSSDGAKNSQLEIQPPKRQCFTLDLFLWAVYLLTASLKKLPANFYEIFREDMPVTLR